MSKWLVLPMICVLVLTGCNTEVWHMTGEYSYKLSGRVEVESEDTLMVKNIDDEIGTLRILSKDNKAEEVVLTLNQLAGGVSTTTAVVEGERLEIEPFEKTMRIASLLPNGEFSVTVSGYAERYQNTLIFVLECSGESLDGEYSLTGEEITMVATRNG